MDFWKEEDTKEGKKEGSRKGSLTNKAREGKGYIYQIDKPQISQSEIAKEREVEGGKKKGKVRKA